MAMNNALLEITCEEIPARFMPGLLADLKAKTEKILAEARLEFSKVETFGTYRRLVLYIENLADRQKDQTSELKGPPAEIAYRDGQPLPPAIGFAKSAGVAIADLQIKMVGNKNYVTATVFKKGESAQKVLPELFPQIITALYLPLSMRWSDLDYKFIRPIHSILALYGKQNIKFELAGIKSNVKCQMSKSKHGIADIEKYKKELKKAGVILDQNERRESIRHQLEALDKNVLIEEDLLEEVNYLAENPAAIAGKFRPEYLRLPKEVLITSMKKNQKYFPVLDNGKLLPKFLLVCDGSAKKYHAGIASGNERVLSARLHDAGFFFEEDKKIPLVKRAGDLNRTAFFEKLGDLGQKTARIRHLSELIAGRLKLSRDEAAVIDRIAFLCKADLSCQMVFEFPDLQGVMGRIYARLSGETSEVANGIFEHYLPRFAGDKLPQSVYGSIVSLADRFDTLTGCFAIGYEPSGSADPYGLRRAAAGIASIICARHFQLDLDEILDNSFKSYGGILSSSKPPNSAIKKFFAARLKNTLAENGIRHDLIDAALENFTDIFETVQKVQALSKASKEEWFKGLRESASRVYRIAKDFPNAEVKPSDLADPEEVHLFEAYIQLKKESEEFIRSGNYLGAVHKMADLTGPVSLFFDRVLVMHQDPRIKNNRLALLKAITMLYTKIGNFDKIVEL